MAFQEAENSSKEIVIRFLDLLDYQHSKLSILTEPVSLFRQLISRNVCLHCDFYSVKQLSRDE